MSALLDLLFWLLFGITGCWISSLTKRVKSLESRIKELEKK